MPANSDRYYSNGVILAFARCVADEEAGWPLRIPGLSGPGLLSVGYDFGQIMVTPADINRSAPDPQDRPYAGLLFVGASWQRMSESRYAAFKVVTGVIGPMALAGQTQKAVHRAFGVAEPRGWRAQLRNEPILNAVYERRWRLDTWGDARAWNGDALLVAGGMLGNVLTQGYGQVQFRGGWRTPDDFGSSLIRGVGVLPVSRGISSWGAHFYMALGGFGVARNLTLDGNSFRDGPRVERRPFVLSCELGAVVGGRAWQVTASWVGWGREFETQPGRAEFGALAVTIFR